MARMHLVTCAVCGEPEDLVCNNGVSYELPEGWLAVVISIDGYNCDDVCSHKCGVTWLARQLYSIAMASPVTTLRDLAKVSEP